MTISMFDHPEYVQRSLQASALGSLGYVLKDKVFSDLLDAVCSIHKGNKYFSQKIAGIAEHYTHQSGNDSLPS